MVTNPGGTSDPAIANMAKFALAFFTFDGTHIAATNSYKEPPADLLRHGREVVVLYGTGFGATSPPTPAGTIVSSAHPLESLSALTISGGVTAKVVFAGVTATGLSIQRESSGDVIQTGTPRWWRRSTARRPKPGR
jgi:uncharacterized protein (TIGR03437 family)